MKAKTNPSQQEFKKFDLILTIENEAEARTLYHFFNAAREKRDRFFKEYFEDTSGDYIKEIERDLNVAWLIMDGLVEDGKFKLYNY